ncbi:hypothetical protein B0H13DRAFT_2293744 [Mycena leptocephala]|nr:hypothetical protein B0H13DRAFT_2293744 [Mycena leptocephala]
MLLLWMCARTWAGKRVFGNGSLAWAYRPPMFLPVPLRDNVNGSEPMNPANIDRSQLSQTFLISDLRSRYFCTPVRTRARFQQNLQISTLCLGRHVHTSAFLACEDPVSYHLLEACTLASLIVLSHTAVFFRTLVNTLFCIRRIATVDPFVGHNNIAEVLKSTQSGIAGSIIAHILAPPIDNIEDWMLNNLNIYPPLVRPHATVTRSHVEYESRSKGWAITLSERIDTCVLTPATAAVTTLGMCVITVLPLPFYILNL